MIIRKRDLENMVTRLNTGRGYLSPHPLTVGAYRLVSKNGGYCVREVVNTSGGVRILGHCYCMSARECYYFLNGLIEGLNV